MTVSNYARRYKFTDRQLEIAIQAIPKQEVTSPCPTCGATVYACKRSSGVWRRTPHASRSKLAVTR